MLLRRTLAAVWSPEERTLLNGSVRNVLLWVRTKLDSSAKVRVAEHLDEKYYLARYADVAGSGIPPFIHYLFQGFLENRDPSRNFVTRDYLSANEDVRRARINPLLHYVLFGLREGRRIPGRLAVPRPAGGNRTTEAVRSVRRVNNYWPDDLPLVSVVITSFNYGRYLREAIESVLAQTFRNFEVIVVEGGSSDPDSVETARNLAREMPQVRFLFREGRHWAGDNRNFGIGAARGRYICCLDADDLLRPIYLEVAVFLAEAYGYDVVYPSLRSFGGFEIEWLVVDASFPAITCENQVSTVALFRRSAWAHVGGYRDWGVGEGYVPEDWDFWLRMVSSGYRVKNIRQPLMLYRVHDGSLSASFRCGTPAQRAKIVEARRGLIETPAEPPDEVQIVNRWANLRQRPSEAAPSVLVALPFVAMGGAEHLFSTIAAGLRQAGRPVVLTTTVALPKSITPYFELFECLTPEIYDLPSLLDSEEWWADFLFYLIDAKNIDTILLAGSEYVYHLLPEIRAKFPKIRVFDQLFNAEGHLRNNRRYSEFIDATIVQSESLREVLVNEHKAGPATIRVIPNGIPVDSKAESVGKRWPGKFVVSFFGRMSPEKGPRVFVEIASRLRQYGEIQFCMAGEGPELEAVLELIRRRRLEDRIWAPGLIKGVHPLIAQSDVVVVPSLLDGMPAVALESQLLGTPVVASRVGGIPEIILDGETGFLCEPGDVEEFCTRILKLYDDGELRARMGERAAAWAQQFSAEGMVASYCSLIDCGVQKERNAARG